MQEVTAEMLIAWVDQLLQEGRPDEAVGLYEFMLLEWPWPVADTYERAGAFEQLAQLVDSCVAAGDATLLHRAQNSADRRQLRL